MARIRAEQALADKLEAAEAEFAQRRQAHAKEMRKAQAMVARCQADCATYMLVGARRPSRRPAARAHEHQPQLGERST